MINLRRDWPTIILVAAMFAAAMWTWPIAPAKIPSHWNASGQVDGYSGRFAGLMLMPIIGAATYLLTGLGPLLRPAKFDARLARALRFESFAVILLLAGVMVVTIAAIHGRVVNMNSVVWPLLVVVFAASGNLVFRAAQSKLAQMNLPAGGGAKR
ncbi:MAG TPA: DUF1648 domain-containing protein [Candidatus Binataceae bacterium]|nr:DUF1648 domain-containing protein [Candidatus Binataceae bacterium]